MSKVRIQRIGENEEVMVERIDDDLVQQYERVQDLKDEAEAAHERFHKIHSEAEGDVEDPVRKNVLAQAAEAMMRAAYAHKMAGGQFWLDVNERYKSWTVDVGIRDNYALVKIKQRGMHDLIRSIFGGF